MSKTTVVLVAAAVAVLIVFGVVRAQEQEQTYALDAPALTATEVDGEIVLSWKEVEGATRYDLRVWDCVNKWQRIGDGPLRTTEAAHTDPEDGITYLYTVQALNERGEESDWAAISKSDDEYDFVRETVNPIPFPEFEIVPQADHIRLVYSEVEEAVGYQARVWYPGAGNKWLWLPEADLESGTVSWFDVEPGVDYFFVMRSYSENRCGFSDWSGYQRHTFAGGATGGGTTGGGTTGGGTTGGGTTGGGEATSTPTSAGTPVPTATRSPGGPNVPGGPDDDGDDDDGDGVTGVADTATPTGTATATGTPTSTGTPTPTALPAPGSVSLSVASNQNASATSSEVQVSWNHADPSADCYEVRRHTYVSESGGTRRVDRKDSSCTNSYNFTGKPASRHFISVRGVNRNPTAYGPWSGERSIQLAVHPGSRPSAPTGVSATNVSNGVRVSWTVDSSKTGHRIDQGDVYEHEIARRISRTHRWSVVATGGRRGLYTDRNVSPGGVYYYRIRSLNIHGYSPSGFTGAHTYVLAPTPTPTPTPIPPTPTPTPTPDPCAGNTCPADPCTGSTCSALDRQCGCDCDCHCDALPALAHEFEDHPLLHELMMERYRTQMPIWSHPYYRLTEFK